MSGPSYCNIVHPIGSCQSVRSSARPSFRRSYSTSRSRVHSMKDPEWNTVAWDTVASTWGLGVGFGSTRTSNWFVSIISNAGIIGAGTYGNFPSSDLFQASQLSEIQLSAELLTTLKLSLLPPLIMSAVVAPGPDFGPWLASGVRRHSRYRGVCSETPFRQSSRCAAQQSPRAAGAPGYQGEAWSQPLWSSDYISARRAETTDPIGQRHGRQSEGDRARGSLPSFRVQC